MRSRRAARRLTVLLASSGTLHFATPKPYDAIVPRALPGSARFWTYVSGVAELVVAGLLAREKTRRRHPRGGAVRGGVPANVIAVRVFWRRPALRAVPLARLPLQIPLVTEALKARE